METSSTITLPSTQLTVVIMPLQKLPLLQRLLCTQHNFLLTLTLLLKTTVLAYMIVSLNFHLLSQAFLSSFQHRLLFLQHKCFLAISKLISDPTLLVKIFSSRTLQAQSIHQPIIIPFKKLLQIFLPQSISGR